jgi:NDP-hexose-3-ketoreductase
MKTVRVGILGCAEIANRYSIPAFRSLPNVEVVAVASRTPEKAKAYAETHGLEAEDYESLLERDDIDVVYIPLPVGLQEEWALKTAAKVKHIICEKSITDSLESAKRMVEACREAGVALYENFVPEFHPQHSKILSLIAEGKIGERLVWSGFDGYPARPADDIRYRKDLGGGAVNYAGCYTVFMARKIMGKEPVAVTCRLVPNDDGVDIAGSALLEFENGEAMMSFGFDRLYQNTYSVWGEKGLVRTDRAFALPPTHVPNIELVTNDGKQESREIVEVQATNQFEHSFDFFCSAVANSDTETINDMYERILKQATVLEAMRVSANEGRRVLL